MILINKFRGGLRQTPFDQNFLAYISQTICNGPGRHITSEYMTCMTSCGLVAGHIGEVAAIVSAHTPNANGVNGLGLNDTISAGINQFQSAFI